MLLTINNIVLKVAFATITILFKSDLYHRHSGNERHFKTDDDQLKASLILVETTKVKKRL